jgi:caffeoyl-CoA O-methyltransferase
VTADPRTGWASNGRIVRPELDAYAEEHTTPPEELLVELAEETRSTLPIPEMLTGPVEGRFLEMLVHATDAKRVLEIGTYSGYSALSMARALTPGGHIDTCEIQERHAEVARRYIERSPYADRITVHVGPAQETIARLDGPYDLVFVDADKTGYDAYYEAALPKLAPRGLIVFDNMLQDGRVVDAPDANDNTRAIVALNRKLRDDPRVTCALLTVRDGVTLVRRAS